MWNGRKKNNSQWGGQNQKTGSLHKSLCPLTSTFLPFLIRKMGIIKLVLPSSQRNEDKIGEPCETTLGCSVVNVDCLINGVQLD